MNTFFEATAEDVNRLSADECVDLLGRMLRADADGMGIPVTAITVTDGTVPDGGIDAHVDWESPNGGHLIVGTYPSYQIKSGKSFKPWQKEVIRKELFGGTRLKPRGLGTETRRCFENRHTYILVCMKVKLTRQRRRSATENLTRVVTECGLPEPDVRVWGQDQVLGFLNSFPSLALQVNGRSDSTVLSHDIWSANDGQEMLVRERGQAEFINKMSAELRCSSKPVHINVFGETGIGKTRLVLEATRDPSLSPLVIYCNSPKFFSERLLPEIRRTNNMRAILVIDDCDPYQICNELKNMNPGIRLVTIYNERNGMPATQPLEAPRLSDERAIEDPLGAELDPLSLEAPRLSDDGIKTILLHYVKDNVVAFLLSVQCGGIPEIAHKVGLDARQNPDNLFGSGHKSHAFERYIRRGDEANSEPVKQRKRILLAISLFKKIGYGRCFQNEMNVLLKLVQKLDAGIHLAHFAEAIETLKSQKMLRGEDTLYLAHDMLHIWLWVRFWETYGQYFDIDDMLKSIPGSLVGWFLDMFEYVSHSDAAKLAVKQLFDCSGPWHSSDTLKTEVGSRLFHAVSRADPQFALLHLEETIGKWPQSNLQNYTTGRRAVIAGLERIMFEPNLFDRGGRLLRSLAEAENEAGSDNATGAFCRMFSLSYGYMANTKAPPSYRMSLLRETLCDQDAKRRSLGLKACRSALRIEYTSMLSLAHGDLDLDIKGWEPSTGAQLQDSYLDVMKLLHEKMATFPADERRAGAQIIMDCSRNLLREFPGISNYVIERLSDIRDAVGQEAMLREILQIIEFDSDRLDPDAIARLERLRDDMAGSSYSDLLNRYVKMDPMVDPIGGKHEESRRAEIKDLAKQSLDVAILMPHLDWLVTNDAKCGNLFGYELSLLDREESLLPKILEAQRRSGENGSGFFLGGYLAGVFEIDRGRWNRTMHKIAEGDELLRFFVEISKSGMTDEIGMVLLDLVRTGRLPASQLPTLAFGLAERPSSGVMVKWIEAMIDSSKPETAVGALRPFYSFFVRRQKGTIDVELALRLLTHSGGQNDPITWPEKLQVSVIS